MPRPTWEFPNPLWDVLEKKGEITPSRNEKGERVYDKESLEKFLKSEYFLRQKEVEEKILEPLSHTADENGEKAASDDADTADQKVIGAVVTEHHEDIAKLLNFKKMFYMAGAFLVTVFFLLVAIITILFLLFPQDTAKFFGLGKIQKIWQVNPPHRAWYWAQNTHLMYWVPKQNQPLWEKRLSRLEM
jgi:hypothetical protein